MSNSANIDNTSLQAGRGNRSPFYPKGRQTEPQALEDVRSLLNERPRRRDLLIEHLHLIQDHYKQLSAAHLVALADEMQLSQSEVYEVATFYHHFDVLKENEDAPAQLTVRVCDGIACEMRGAKALFAGLAETYGRGNDVRVVHAPCVGACDKAPVAVVGQRQVYGADVAVITAAVDANETEPDVPNYKDFNAYVASGGYVVWKDCLAGNRQRADVIAQIDLIKGAAPSAPRFVTPGSTTDHLSAAGYEVTTGIGPDLLENSRAALRRMVALVSEQQNLSPIDVYLLCSVCADMRLSQVVDEPNWIVSCYFSRIVFEQE